MRISRIYYDGNLAAGESINLPLETSHYIANVLRLKMGSPFILFNGKGGQFNACIKAIQQKHIIAELTDYSTCQRESPLNIHLAQSISRSEKMDFILQKAVELGVKKVTPLVTEFCNIKLDEDRANKRLAHWRKVMISACEQSGRTSVPDLESIQKFESWLNNDLAPFRLFCDPRARIRLSELNHQQDQDIVLLIGPEGGFSDREVKEAQANHFVGISLGPRILRTETASLVAISILQHCWGDV